MVNDRVIYKFYKKKVSKQTVIHASSALPANTKRHALVNEGLRRLRLTDRSLPWSEIESIMTVFSNTLRCSGYSAAFRGEVIEAAIKGFRRQCEAADSGTGPSLFRPRSYKSEKRRNKKIMGKDSWYRPHHDVVGFIPLSPGGELLAGLQRIVREEGNKIGMKIKLVEQSGVAVRALLTRPDLSGCLFPDCDIEEDGASHLPIKANSKN